jgi:hypothetical protein
MNGMHVIDTSVNFTRSQHHDINATVRSLTPEQKQSLLDTIQCRAGAYKLVGQSYDTEMYKRIEKMLKETSR